MRQEIIACEQAVMTGNIKIVPVVKLSVLCLDIGGGTTFHAVKQPQYILVTQNGHCVVYRVTGENISIDQAMKEYPAMEEALARLEDFHLPSD